MIVYFFMDLIFLKHVNVWDALFQNDFKAFHALI